MGCHLHSKPKKNCKFCQRFEEAMNRITASFAVSSAKESSGKVDDMSNQHTILVSNSKTFGFSPLLQTHIVESAHLKALLTLETFDQLIEEMYQFADNIEPYMSNSST